MTAELRLLVGFHAINARLRHQPDSVREIYVDARRRDPRVRDLTALAGARGVRVVSVDDARLAGLAGDARHQGVVARVEPGAQPVDLDELLQGLSQPAFLLLLDGVTDPHNLGACLRVADAMGAHAVIVPKDRSAGLSPVVVKAASGATESVPLIPVTNLARTVEELKTAGVQVLGAAEEGSRTLLEMSLDGAIAWAVGAEGAGLRRLTRERCDTLVRIPMFGQVESLNVSVAAALCLYETRRQREASARSQPVR